ncbi:uncharacterized protein [Asterias amurensis]|uniref:uncharacterized protein isoform X1 n=1 Tax=Asterias amurensis TaxID=7602 RepID=UPI003AB382FB
MEKTGTILLVVLAALCAGLPEVIGRIRIIPPSGYEINLYCHIRNHQGESVFYRVIDDRNVTLSQGSKYLVTRCNKTTSHVHGEDSVLIITEAQESDSGTYGCTVNVKGIIDWSVSDETNLTVHPAYSREDPSHSMSPTAPINKAYSREDPSHSMSPTAPINKAYSREDPSHSMSPTAPINKEQGSGQQSDQSEDNEKSGGNQGLIAAVVFLSLVVLTLSIALAVVSLKLFRVHKDRSYGTPDEQGEGEADGVNTTQLDTSFVQMT